MTAAVSPSAPVAWRWRFHADDAWHYGPDHPGPFRFGDPDEVQPLYASPAPSMVGLREKVDAVIRERTQIGGTDWDRWTTSGDINSAELADAILALLAREGVGG